MGYSQWSYKELNMTEQLMTKHTAHSLYRYAIASLSAHLFVDGHIGCFFGLEQPCFEHWSVSIELVFLFSSNVYKGLELLDCVIVLCLVF